jgi:hypothetical protein
LFHSPLCRHHHHHHHHGGWWRAGVTRVPKQLRRPAICFGGWWGTGVTRAPKQLRRPAIGFGGWWGQPANRTKQAKQNNRRLPGVRITSRPSPGTQAQQAHLNKDRPEAAQRSTAQRGPRGKAGKQMLMPDCLPVGLSCATDYCCNACSVPSHSKPHRVPRPTLRNQTSKKAADGTTMKPPCVRKHGTTPSHDKQHERQVLGHTPGRGGDRLNIGSWVRRRAGCLGAGLSSNSPFSYNTQRRSLKP